MISTLFNIIYKYSKNTVIIILKQIVKGNVIKILWFIIKKKN